MMLDRLLTAMERKHDLTDIFGVLWSPQNYHVFSADIQLIVLSFLFELYKLQSSVLCVWGFLIHYFLTVRCDFSVLCCTARPQ